MSAQGKIEQNIRAHSSDGYTAWHMVAQAHERTIRDLSAELAVLRGHGQTAQRGAYLTVKPFGDAEVLVEYEYTAGEEPIFDADRPGVGPGHDADVHVLGVFINGVWCDADDVVPPKTLERWECEFLESMAEGEPA